MQDTIKVAANSVKLGNILVHNGELCVVSSSPQHVKPGKGPAYMQIELKNLKKGTKYNLRFNSTEYLEKAFLTQRDCQYLYWEANNIILMDYTNHELIPIPATLLGDKAVFLKDSAVNTHLTATGLDTFVIKVEFYGDEIVNINLPSSIVLEISETVPAIKGSTVTSSYKPATLNNGLEVKVPPYMSIGDKIVIKTEDYSFIERAK